MWEQTKSCEIFSKQGLKDSANFRMTSVKIKQNKTKQNKNYPVVLLVLLVAEILLVAKAATSFPYGISQI